MGQVDPLTHRRRCRLFVSNVIAASRILCARSASFTMSATSLELLTLRSVASCRSCSISASPMFSVRLSVSTLLLLFLLLCWCFYALVVPGRSRSFPCHSQPQERPDWFLVTKTKTGRSLYFLLKGNDLAGTTRFGQPVTKILLWSFPVVPQMVGSEVASCLVLLRPAERSSLPTHQQLELW